MTERRRIDAFMQFTGAMVPEWLCVRTELDAGPKLAYARLARFKGRKAYAYPTLEELGVECGVGERQASRYITKLASLDLIEVERVGLNEPNRYYFLDHPWMHEPGEEVAPGPDTCVGSGPDTRDASGVDTSDRSGPDTSVVSRADTSDRSLYALGSQSGSHSPNPHPSRAAGTNPRAVGTNPRSRPSALERCARCDASGWLLDTESLDAENVPLVPLVRCTHEPRPIETVNAPVLQEAHS